MTYPDLKKAEELAAMGLYHTMPVSMEMFSDMYTPVGVLRKLKNVSEHCYMLESAEDAKRWGRYSFLGFEPTLEISCRNGMLHMKGREVREVETACPGEYIRQVVEAHRAPKIEGMPSFTGGLVGYFSYDYIKYVEPSLKLDARDESHFRDLDLMLFDQVIVFDNLKQKMILIVNMSLDKDVKKEYEDAVVRLKRLEAIVRDGELEPHIPLKVKNGFQPHFTKEKYCRMVEEAKHHIYEGDIFQVVLSNRLEAEIEGNILDVYRVLRSTNPSPYMFYFSSNDIEIAGASPETLVKLENGTLGYISAGGNPEKRGDLCGGRKAGGGTACG